MPHQVRAYPLKNSGGSVVSNAYVIAFEETTSACDFQDLVFIVRNVKPAPTSAGGQISVANQDGVPYPNRMVFSRIGTLASPPSNGVHDRATLRISNTGTGPLQISSFTFSGPWQLVSPPALPASIAAGGSLDVTVRFVAESGNTWNGSLTIASNDASTPDQVVQLAGYWQASSEGGLEPLLPTVVNSLFNYQTQLLFGGQQLNRNGHVETAGEEVLSPYWRRADPTKPVTVRQLDAFHTQGNTATIHWYPQGGTVVRTSSRTPGSTGRRSCRARTAARPLPAAGNFSPPRRFGFKIDTEWSDDT